MSIEPDGVFVDGVKIDAFVRELDRNCARLKACLDAANSDLSALGRTWQDEQYKQFKSKLGSVTARVEQFNVWAARAQLQLTLDAEAAKRIHRDTLPGA